MTKAFSVAVAAAAIIAALAPAIAAESGPVSTMMRTTQPRDLAISSINVTLKPGFTINEQAPVASVVVAFRDYCNAPGTIGTYVQISIHPAKGSPSLAMVGNETSLTNGQGQISFDVNKYNVPASSYIYAQIDPTNKIVESVENNNYMSRNPNTAPFPPPASACKPKLLP